MQSHRRRRETQTSGRKPLAPFGLRAAAAHLLCCPPRRCYDIDCVGAPCISTPDAQNATRGAFTTGS